MTTGIFYNDYLEPWTVADLSTITLSTTAKALYTAGQFPPLGSQFFNRVGKKLKIEMFGKITTAATPGNGSFNVYYGTGADANGTAIMTGTPVALIASQTNISWEAKIFVHVRSIGATGTLFCRGKAHFGAAVSGTPVHMLPASGAAVSSALDLTSSNIISVQFLRSGSTAETMTIQDMEVTSLN